MARMSIDDMFLRDPRVGILALELGCNKYEARGRLLEVWSICYDRVSEALPEAHVDAASEIPGFASALVKAGLAECACDGVIRISGVKQRVEYLEAKARAGRKGGVKSGESRRNTHEAKPKQPRSTPQAPPNPSVPDSVPDSVPVPDPVPDPVPVGKEVRLVTDAFQAYFLAGSGVKPNWGPTETAQIKKLLKKQPCAEIVRRIQILSTSPPDFPKGLWDWRTFVANNDRCAVPNNGKQTTAGSLLQWQLERVKASEQADARSILGDSLMDALNPGRFR